MLISKELLGFLAVALVLIAYLPYIRDIIRKKISPHPYSWLVWAVTTTAIFFIQTTNGSGTGAYMTAAVAVFMMIIFLLALRNNKAKMTNLDIICLVVAGLGVLIWLFIDRPLLSVFILLSIELIGFIPTLLRGWAKPYGDSATLWGVNSLRQLTGLAAVQNYNVVTMFNPLVWICIGVMYFTVLLVRRQEIKKPRNRKRVFNPYI